MRTFALAAMMLACAAGAAHGHEDLANEEMANGEMAKPEGLAASAETPDALAPNASDLAASLGAPDAQSAPDAQDAQGAPDPAVAPTSPEYLESFPISAEDRVIPDPWEKFNRGMFAVNDVLDRFILAPAAIAYAVITPKPLRRGINNALDNANSPVVIGNDLLQLKFKRAGVAIARLAVNSTIGLGGFLDVGSRIGLKEHAEDFGQTLGKWGVSTGPYLFLPLLGPTTVRDAVGAGADTVMTPFAWTEFGGFKVLRWSRAGLTALDARAEALRPLAELRRTSADPYVTIRTFYALARKSAITDGTEDAGDLPEFADPLEADALPGTDAQDEAPVEEAAPDADPQGEEVQASSTFIPRGAPMAITASPGFAPVEADLQLLY